MAKEIYMEDIESISFDAVKMIEYRLKEYGVVLPDSISESEIYDPIFRAIEKLAKYPDYRNHN